MFLFPAFFVLFFLVKRGNFTSIFFGIAFVFLLFFYIYPLSLLFNENSLYYAGYNFEFNKDKYLFSVLSALVFIFGFFIPDAVLILKRKKGGFASDLWQFNQIDCDKYKYKYKRLFYIILLIVISYFIIGLLNPNRALDTYEIRRGSSEGSMFKFLITIIINTLFFSVVFCLLYTKRFKSTLFVFIIKLVYLLTGSTGRSVLMLNLLLLIMYLFRIRAKQVVLVSIGILILLMPIILNMKEIIYSISVNSTVPNLVEIYLSTPDVETLLTNFGHPLVSLINVQGLIDIVGYRFFYDYIQGFLFYLRAFGFDFGDSLIYFNTENITGIRSSIVPTGYLAFGYVQLGLLGVIVSGMFYRLVGYIAEFVYYKINVENDLVKLYFAYFAGISFYHGEIRVMVITFFIPALIMYLFRPSKLVKLNT